MTVGTACTMSAVGSSETHRALVEQSPYASAFSAMDAGLVTVADASTAEAPRFLLVEDGSEVSAEQIEARFGERLRAQRGIRRYPREKLASHVLTDIAAPLPHDLEDGGLRRLCGVTFEQIRQSPFRDMFGLFQDDPRLGPSLQSLLFLYGGLGALAALPRPLSEILPEAHRFRVAAGTAFFGHESFENLSLGMQPKAEQVPDKKSDKLAYRLSALLNTHGPALINTLLSPIYPLSKVRKNPEMLSALRAGATGLCNVPQAPLVSSAACASALVAFCDAATSMVCRYPGHHAPSLCLWTAADAALQPDGRLLEAFGLGAMMSRDKLRMLNEGRAPEDRRTVSDCLCPFDVDAQGTVVGHAGSGLLVTTLQFAVEHALDITSIIVGWGQSGETGGKGHFAGVGFGGDNALVNALEMARIAHGLGVEDFGHLVAHATGTRTNSRTDLSNVHEARQVSASRAGLTGRLPAMTVGAPKAIGDGHSMGETGLKATGEAVHYVLGERTIGVPTLRRLDDQLGPAGEYFEVKRDPVLGNNDGGAFTSTQGFGGYDGALALFAANPDTIARYAYSNDKALAAYRERWPEIRRERVEREAATRRAPGFARRLAEEHRWR